MKKTKKALASLAIAGMVLSMAPVSVFAADDANRIYGADRYATSIKIAEKAYASATTAVIAAGNPNNLVDALAAAPLAAQEEAPIYLTDKADMNDDAVASLKKLGVSKVFVVGAAASEAVVTELKAAGLEVEELKGAGRVETAEAINAKLTAPKGTIVVGYNGVADAMSVASYAAANNYAIVVAKADGTIPGTAAADYVIGGPTMVKDIAGAERIFGADRYETNKKVLAELSFDFGTVYVGNGATLADALVASVLAAQTDSPILLSDGKTVEAAATAGSMMTSDSKVIALGGTGVVSDVALNSVKPVVPETKTVEVESVSALNLRQILVEFNMEVDEDSAIVAGNYSVKTSGNVDLTGADISLQEDKKSVVITLTDANKANQQEKIDLTVEDVEDLDENEITKKTFEDIEFLDTTLPEAEKAEVVGNDTIKVYFSEPVSAAKADFEVNDGELYVKDVQMVNNDTEANVILYSNLENGKVTVDVKTSAVDAAGFGVKPKSFELNVVEDTEAPFVVSYKEAKPTEVTLVFNEDIEIADNGVANFYHTNSNNTVDDAGAGVADYTLDGKELTLKFTTNELPEGTAYVYIAADAINDLWDNENDKIMVKVDVDVDETAPVLEDLDVESESQIKLTFSEDVTDVEKSDFSVVDKDGDSVSIKRVTANADTVTIDFSDDLSGDYTIVIEDVKDAASNKIAKTTKNFSVDDLTAPVYSDFTATLYNAGAEDQMIKVDFDQEMATEGKYSVLDLEKYTVGSHNLAELDCNVTIVAVDGGKGVEILIPSFTVDDDTDGVDLTVADDITLARVADVAGNYTAAAAGTIDVLGASTVGISKVEATDVDEVKITFDDELTKFDVEDLILYVDDNATGDGYTAADTELAFGKVSLSLSKDGDTVATLTLAPTNELDYYGKSGGLAVQVATVAAPVSENAYGENLAGDLTAIDATRTGKDKIAPAVAVTNNDDEDPLVYTYDVNENGVVETIVIEYTENIESDVVNKLTYTVDGLTVTSAIVSEQATAALASEDSSAADGKFVVIKVKETDSKGDLRDVDGGLVVDVEQVLKIYDTASVANAKDADGEVLSSMDTAAPAIVSAVKNSATQITLTLSEDVVANLLTNGTGWAVTDSRAAGDGGPQAFAVSAQQITNDTVVLTVASMAAAVGDINVAYTTQADKNEDAEGNDLASDSIVIDVTP